VQLQAAGDITDKAGDAEAHVCGVAELDQQHSQQAYDAAANQQISLLFHFSFTSWKES
jgi:hypothetical protein